MQFKELLSRIELIKSGNYNVKIPTPAFANLIMSGAMDEMFDHPLTLKERLKAIEDLKTAAGSEATLSNAKQPQLDINKIKNEFSRMRWLKNTNPLFSFNMYEYYSQAVLSMENYKPFNRNGIVYIKTEEQANTWIFKNWTCATKPEIVNIIQNNNKDYHQTTKIGIGFVCVLDKYAIKKNEQWGDICEVTFNDGQDTFNAVIWADRDTKKTPPKLLAAIKSLPGKPCIALGKLSVKNDRIGMNLYKVQELLT